MKKVLFPLFILLIIFMCSCTNNSTLDTEVSVITPKGIPFLAIGGLLEEENVNIESVAGAENLQTALATGSHDIVIAPLNLGAKLYNANKSNYKVAAIVTANNAYIVSREENPLDSVYDLVGEKVIAFGATGIPGNILKTVYERNDLLDVEDIDFSFSSSADVYSVFAGDSTSAKYALMSEPEITKLQLKDNIKVKKIDLCDVLGVYTPQACIFVNPNSDKELVNKVLEMIEDNSAYLNNNPDKYAKKVVKLDKSFELMGKDIISNSIPNANIEYKNALDSRMEIENILTIIGVTLPNDEFYY